jgi:GAF domain-containing protein
MSTPAHPGRPGDDRSDGRRADLLEMLTSADSLEGFLTDLVHRAVGEVGAASACGLGARSDPGSPLLIAASDGFARGMDEVQYTFDDGPCLTALRDNLLVDVPDVAGDPRWPHFSEHGRAQGARSSLSVPMSVDGRAVGALNLYARTVDAFTSVDRARAEQFAADAADTVALAARLADKEERIRHLRRALTSRSVIDHATGILMGRYRITARDAFDLLRKGSQNSNTKIRDIAGQLVHDTTGQPPAAPDPEQRSVPNENS